MGEVRKAAWCRWMALAGDSGHPLLSEGGPGVLPLLAGGPWDFGLRAGGCSLLRAPTLVLVTPGLSPSGLGLQVLPLALRPALMEE